jgi:hypothetical protein
MALPPLSTDFIEIWQIFQQNAILAHWEGLSSTRSGYTALDTDRKEARGF